MLFESARILFLGRLHPLFGDFDVHAGAVSQFFAGANDNFFQFLLGALKFLLVEQGKRLIILLHLRLNERVNHFYASALGRVQRS